ncbi:SPFH domain-containing protein [Actinoplanes sp. NPDC049265]|uniref:SPFH domain-containing protein n=1 Tax=Actinoplanes sp. NPDC049265 TaxID=3363902 RepID=UPI003714DE5D
MPGSLIPGLAKVPPGMVGVVSSRYGSDKRDVFDIKMFGSRGVQAPVLAPNTMRVLDPTRYRVAYRPQTYVPDGTIGLVNALAGRAKPPGRALCQYIKDTNNFQDGTAFLRNGGEQGRQLGYLPGGARYNINPELFQVITVDTPDLLARHHLSADDLHDVQVIAGNTGVVITRIGRQPGPELDELGHVVEGHERFQLPWVFLGRGGHSGVQAETLEVGSYTINPWFARVVQIPTRELTLEWTSRTSDKPDNFDAGLERIVVNIQGYRIALEVAQTLTIPPVAAPRLVRRFGQGDATDPSQARREPVQRFVGRVLGATVSGYFNEIVGKYQVMEFIIKFGVLRAQLQDKVVNALEGWGVVAGETILESFTPEDSQLDTLRQALAGQDMEIRLAIRERELLTAKKSSRELQAAIDRVGIELRGEEEVVVLRRQIELLGPYQVALERIVERMGDIKVPQFIGGDTADQLLSAMPMAHTQEMIRTMLEKYSASDGDPAVPLIADAEVQNPAGPPDEPVAEPPA